MDSSLILYFIGAGFIIVGAGLWRKGNHLLSHGKKATAIIFKHNLERDTYFPVVRFLTDKQEWITQELSVGYSLKKNKEGTKVDVIYDPDDPTNVEIHSSFQLELLPWLFVVLGVMGIVLASLELLEIIDIWN